MRELVLASVIGSLGALLLAFGLQSYLNPDNPMLGLLESPRSALLASGAGCVLLMLEVRLLVPALRALRASNRP